LRPQIYIFPGNPSIFFLSPFPSSFLGSLQGGWKEEGLITSLASSEEGNHHFWELGCSVNLEVRRQPAITQTQCNSSIFLNWLGCWNIPTYFGIFLLLLFQLLQSF
jgi:hypothetical protein